MLDKLMLFTPLPKGFLRHPAHLMAFGFGSGCFAKAPGTWGTLAGLLLYIPLQPLALTWQLAIIIVAFTAGIAICERASRALGVHDHGGIVWDEFVGFWITMFAAPTGWLWLLWGFVLFRIFDIWKPWPIRWADGHVHGGLGIMLDDVLAGVYAAIVLQLSVLVVQ